MNGLSTQDTPDIRVEEIEGFDFKNPLQSSFVEARNAARQLKVLYDREKDDRNKLERAFDKLEAKYDRAIELHASEIKHLQKDNSSKIETLVKDHKNEIEKLTKAHEIAIEKLTQEWERRLGDSEKSNSLSGIAREVLTPDVLKELGPGVVSGVFGLLNKTQSGGVSYTPEVKAVADLIAQATADEQTKVLNLINSIVNVAGDNPGAYIDNLITQINTQNHGGTSSN
ncbi:hypothetical protein [Roseivirga seohaensis]|uniref:hypothetical protein n=1 Tax=Roseivirga seohaensis TaxID=1914963 RepID=UPI003BA93DE3